LYQASRNSCNLYIIDSGATVHIFNKIIKTKTKNLKSSVAKIQGISGQILKASYQGDDKIIGRYLIVPDATSN
jgi:hypothetical protein